MSAPIDPATAAAMAMPAVAPPDNDVSEEGSGTAVGIGDVEVGEEEAVFEAVGTEVVISAARTFQPPPILVETTMFVRDGLVNAICMATDADDDAARELIPRFGFGNQLQQLFCWYVVCVQFP